MPCFAVLCIKQIFKSDLTLISPKISQLLHIEQLTHWWPDPTLLAQIDRISMQFDIKHKLIRYICNLTFYRNWLNIYTIHCHLLTILTDQSHNSKGIVLPGITKCPVFLSLPWKSFYWKTTIPAFLLSRTLLKTTWNLWQFLKAAFLLTSALWSNVRYGC